MSVDEKCPRCGNSLSYEGKSSEHDAHGHSARLFRCKNNSCPRDKVLGGWANT